LAGIASAAIPFGPGSVFCPGSGLLSSYSTPSASGPRRRLHLQLGHGTASASGPGIASRFRSSTASNALVNLGIGADAHAVGPGAASAQLGHGTASASGPGIASRFHSSTASVGANALAVGPGAASAHLQRLPPLAAGRLAYFTTLDRIATTYVVVVRRLGQEHCEGYGGRRDAVRHGADVRSDILLRRSFSDGTCTGVIPVLLLPGYVFMSRRELFIDKVSASYRLGRLDAGGNRCLAAPPPESWCPQDQVEMAYRAGLSDGCDEVRWGHLFGPRVASPPAYSPPSWEHLLGPRLASPPAYSPPSSPYIVDSGASAHVIAPDPSGAAIAAGVAANAAPVFVSKLGTSYTDRSGHPSTAPPQVTPPVLLTSGRIAINSKDAVRFINNLSIDNTAYDLVTPCPANKIMNVTH
jgi:hypothetical protein